MTSSHESSIPFCVLQHEQRDQTLPKVPKIWKIFERKKLKKQIKLQNIFGNFSECLIIWQAPQSHYDGDDDNWILGIATDLKFENNEPPIFEVFTGQQCVEKSITFTMMKIQQFFSIRFFISVLYIARQTGSISQNVASVKVTDKNFTSQRVNRQPLQVANHIYESHNTENQFLRFEMSISF